MLFNNAFNNKKPGEILVLCDSKLKQIQITFHLTPVNKETITDKTNHSGFWSELYKNVYIKMVTQ